MKRKFVLSLIPILLLGISSCGENNSQKSAIACSYNNGYNDPNNCVCSKQYITIKKMKEIEDNYTVISLNMTNLTTDSHYPHYHYTIIYK